VSRTNTNITLLALFISVAVLAFLQDSISYRSTQQLQPDPVWYDYTNHELGISLSYPPGWEVLEIPNQIYESSIPQVWLTSSDFPPPQTGARPDFALLVLQQDPSAEWDSHYFDNYKSEMISLDIGPAVRVSGHNKEGQIDEVAYIAQLGSNYVLALSGHSSSATLYFDRIVSTLNWISH
jgi:hypothetical protein